MALLQAVADLQDQAYLELVYRYVEEICPELIMGNHNLKFISLAKGITAYPAVSSGRLYAGRLGEDFVVLPINPALIASTPEEAEEIIAAYDKEEGK